MKDLPVTVVIPTYNRAHFLREAIQSVLNQTYTQFELLISDNASSDETADVVAGFQDRRIHYHRQPQNIGMTANWQSAIMMAETELIAALSDDDLYLPNHLATAVDALTKYPQATYYTCPARRFGSNSSGELRPIAITDRQTPLIYFPPEQAVKFLGIDNPGPMMTMVCRKKALHANLFWGKPDFLPQDLLVMTQLMVQGGFVFGNSSTADYRIHENNASYRPADRLYKLRLNCMVWYGIRYLAQFLLSHNVCQVTDIETHGLQASSPEHVVPLVLGLASFEAPANLRTVARRIFEARTDMDPFSARFRLARRLGFVTIPIAERISQSLGRWRPS